MRKRAVVFACLFAVSTQLTYAQVGKDNFPGRKALIVNSLPFIQLSGFSFQNFYARTSGFRQDLTWKNVGAEAVVAFEVVILKYDPFDERLIGDRWIITGKNSADWSPLLPGESSSDATLGYRSEKVFTAIAYVRSARLQGGTVWHVDEAALLAELKKVAPDLKQFGSLEPDPESVKPEP